MMRPNTLLAVLLLTAAPAFAQAPAPAAPAAPASAPQGADAQLRLIVVDPTGAGLPTANVTLTPPVGAPIVVMTDERGVVAVPAIVPGATKVTVEFYGFETHEGQLTLRRGANNQTITLRLAGVTDEVVVSGDSVITDTRGAAMVTALSDQEIEALPDDPEDLQAYLEELVGPGGATFFLNGFRGGRLPTKDEIRSIRIRQNSFSADGHESGGRGGVEIITRPAVESFAGNLNFGYQGDALNARNAQALTETPEGNKQVQLSFRGPIARGKTAFSLSVNGTDRYTSNNIIAVDEFGNRIGEQVRMPTEQRSFNTGIEHALTQNSTLRLTYQQSQSEGRNQGLGNFDLTERARQTESEGNLFRAQVQGIVGKSNLNELRFQFNRNYSANTSMTVGPTVIVQDAFSRGSAGVNSNSTSYTFELADNFDFTPHPSHQMRVGVLLEGGRYDQFDHANAYGRTVYASLEDYRNERPLQFTQRLGDPLQTSFDQYQFGFYIQDDIRVNNRLTLGVGVRNEMQSHVGDKLNLMPRIGFSLNPGGDRTSIRGGYGIYYDWYEANLHDLTLRLNGVAQPEIQINYDPLTGLPLDSLAGPGPRPSNRTVAAPGLDMPYLHQASIGVQHQLLPSVNMQLTYQRQEGRNQLRAVDINTPRLDPNTGLMARPDPTSGIVTEIQSTGRSQSDRLTFQTRFQLPQQRGMVQVSYQLGQSEADFLGATSLPSNSLDPSLDWGPQGQDIRHQFQTGGMVRLPYDFRLQGNFQFRSAPAYNLTTGLDNNLDGVINDRPEGVGRNSLRGEPTWHLTQLSLNKAFGFGGSRGGATGTPTGGRGPGNQQGMGGGFPGGGRGPGGRGNFGGASDQRYQVQLSLRASNPLNRVIQTGWTGNMRSPFFMTATGVQSARRIEFETSFRF